MVGNVMWGAVKETADHAVRSTLRILRPVWLTISADFRCWRAELQLVGSTELLLGGGRRDAHEAGDAAHPAEPYPEQGLPVVSAAAPCRLRYPSEQRLLCSGSTNSDWSIDHDDASSWFEDSQNVMVCKRKDRYLSLSLASGLPAGLSDVTAHRRVAQVAGRRPQALLREPLRHSGGCDPEC